jgi:hypothetical protein
MSPLTIDTQECPSPQLCHLAFEDAHKSFLVANCYRTSGPEIDSMTGCEALHVKAAPLAGREGKAAGSTDD